MDTGEASGLRTGLSLLLLPRVDEDAPDDEGAGDASADGGTSSRERDDGEDKEAGGGEEFEAENGRLGAISEGRRIVLV